MTEREPTKLGEVLRSAREAKFIDLARVERDTKIRVRYLSALESGDYRDLPGAVYTRGFLRNYGLYLGLDPEYLVDLYRLELGSDADRRTVPIPPQPIAARQGRPLVVTSGAVAAVILTLVVAAFAVYLVGEFLTFARTPDLRITDPAADLPAYAGSQYLIRGITEPSSTVTTDGLRENPSAMADANGDFSVLVGLVPGVNLITLVANDPLTGRNSAAVRRTITVVSDASPSPTGDLRLIEPLEGATVGPALRLAGNAPPGSRIAVRAAFVAAALPSFSVVTLAGHVVALPGSPPVAPADQEYATGTDATWVGAVDLSPGTWDVSVALVGDAAASVVRRVIVEPEAGLHGSLTISGDPSYLELDEDGVPKAGISGQVLTDRTIELRAEAALRIRVGNAAAVLVTINGIAMPVMGPAGGVVEWQVTRLP